MIRDFASGTQSHENAVIAEAFHIDLCTEITRRKERKEYAAS